MQEGGPGVTAAKDARQAVESVCKGSGASGWWLCGQWRLQASVQSVSGNRNGRGQVLV